MFRAKDVVLGRNTLNELLETMIRGDHSGMYAPGYQLMLSSGERAVGVRTTRLSQKVQPQNLEAIRSGRLMAIRYDMPNALTVNDGGMAQASNPRLLTYYLGDNGQWLLTASAVLAVSAKAAEQVKCVKADTK